MTGKPAKKRYGVAAVVFEEGRFLVIKRSRHVVAPGKYCFPGGGIEKGETAAEAVVREMREELGVDVQPILCLWKSVTPWNVDISWWRVTLAAEFILQPNPREIASFFWLTAEELTDNKRLLESNRHFLEALARGKFSLDLDAP